MKHFWIYSPRKIIKNSGRFYKDVQQQHINGTKSEIINRRMRLNKQRYIYKTELYRYTDFIL